MFNKNKPIFHYFQYFNSLTKIIVLFFSLSSSLFGLADVKNSKDINASPRSVLENFELNLTPDNYNPKQAAKSLPPSVKNAGDTAELLKKVLDGKGYVFNKSKISNDTNYVDSATLNSVFYPIPLEKDIYIEKVNGNWYFSNSTIDNLPQIYKEVYKFEIDPSKFLKGKFWKIKFLNISIAGWLGVILLIVLSIALYHILISLSKLINYKRLFNIKSGNSKKEGDYLYSLARILSLYVAFTFFISLLPSLQLPLRWNSFLLNVSGMASVIFLILFINKVIYAIEYILLNSKTLKNRNYNRQLIPIIGKVLRGLIWFFGILYILKIYLNVNVMAIITGLSIGGLALALAAQDTVKNFLGSAIIFLDRPFEVNDWIEFDKYEGKVIDIGIRSTIIKTVDNYNVYVPNSSLSNNVVNNKGNIRYKSYKTFLNVNYNTPVEILHKFIEGLEDIIKNNPYTLKNKYEVHISELNDNSISVLFMCFYTFDNNTSDFAARHEILKDILTLGEKLKIHLSSTKLDVKISNTDS